ncbi:hypothetical protein G3M48_000221 [Beauveria asiatica]|uniref:Secreted protein n=1 Tax=Beauveria asiatica TaxID=1069075 RepID=A0AAW0S3K6_9HYPO
MIRRHRAPVFAGSARFVCLVTRLLLCLVEAKGLANLSPCILRITFCTMDADLANSPVLNDLSSFFKVWPLFRASTKEALLDKLRPHLVPTGI